MGNNTSVFMVQDIQKPLMRIVGAPTLVLFVMLGLSLLSIRVLTNLGEAVVHTQEVRGVAQSVLGSLIDMEASLRGYIASHDPIFLEPYMGGKKRTEKLYADLERLTMEDATHKVNLLVLHGLTDRWMLYAESVRKEIGLERKFSPPPQSFLRLEGKELMDDIRARVSEIISYEENQYAFRATRVRNSVRWAMYSILALAIILAGFIVSYLRKEILRLSEEFARNLREVENKKRELEALNNSLEDAVNTRTAALLSTNAELEAFCYSVSHDLRAPLRGIDGFSEALQSDFGKILPEDAKTYLKYIRQGIQRMGSLIDDLLALSRLSRVEPVLQDVDLAEVAKEIVEDLHKQSPSRHVRFLSLKHAPVRGDLGLLRAAMTNLLSNAWKFTEKVEHPVVEFGTTKIDGKQVFFVRDSGVGFDMAHYSKLFGAFQRLHSTKEYPGTGVGLATVRRIFRRHGGDVWAEAKVGEGATFFFNLENKEGI